MRTYRYKITILSANENLNINKVDTGTRTMSRKQYIVRSSLGVLKAFSFLDVHIVSLSVLNKTMTLFFLQGKNLLLF